VETPSRIVAHTKASIYVLYPEIAQDDVNKSTIINTAQIVMDPSAESLNLTIDGTLETTSIFHPTLRPFNASLYLEGASEPFTSFTVPSIHAKNGTNFTVSQVVEVLNLGELTTYSEFLLALETFNVQLRGHGNLKLGGLPTVGINYNQTIKIKGELRRSPNHVRMLTPSRTQCPQRPRGH